MNLQRYEIIFSLALLMFCDSCNHDTYREVEPYLSSKTFNFSVSPQDSVLHVGDTITFSAIIDNRFNDTALTNGHLYLGFSLFGSSHIPQDSMDEIFSAYNGIHYILVSDAGNPCYAQGTTGGSLYADTVNLEADSFKIKFSLVMLKKGLYQLQIHDGSLECTFGTAPILGNFTPQDHHWHFFQMPNVDTPKSGTQDYRESYLFAVE